MFDEHPPTAEIFYEICEPLIGGWMTIIIIFPSHHHPKGSKKVFSFTFSVDFSRK
jgi:hypothetical protein